jgi:predicted transcriptional regulator
MCQMLLSINPEHVRNILGGTKLFEFRKVRCRADVDKIIIYATAPKKMVVAEAEIEEVIEGTINDVWRQAKDYAGIRYSFYRSYYKGKKKAVAYKLRNICAYQEPRSLSDYGVDYPPQSFIYLEAAT